VGDGDGATTRQIVGGFERYRARKSANARRRERGIGITAAKQHRSCRARSRILVEATPYLAGVVFSAAAWPIRGA
jgi:hypothetical protein